MKRVKKRTQLIFQGILVGFVLIISGCTASSLVATSASSLDSSASPTPAATTTSTGTRAVKILFQLTSGSFDTPSSGGTTAAAGSGLQAVRIFNADGSTLASSTSTTNWPTWFTSFEMGISGASNSASTNTACAGFAGAAEGLTSNCTLNTASGSLSRCGATNGQFRVSEVDCNQAPAAVAGNGSSSDGIYMRAQFNRSGMATTENILVVMEYAASALNPAPSSPTSCFTAGQFTPEVCSDFVWRAYLRHSTSESAVQPFLLLIPPTFSSVLGPTQTAALNAGTGIATKQFILPMAGDQNLTVLQISRTGSAFPSAANLLTYCTASGSLPGNSPLCAGVIFYSITFFRI